MIRRLLFLSLLFLAACEEVIEPTAPPLPVAAVSASANADRAALVALYEATDGPNWTHNENWMTDAPLGDWYGVEVDASGRVVGLDLGGKFDDELRRWVPHGLSGEIPPELGQLSALRRLVLYHNALTGSIPSELGNLSALQTLDLANNTLTDSLPPELGQLPALERLRLSANDLSGSIPPQLGQLFTLKYLSLDRNNLTGIIPPEFGNLAELQTLDLYHNSLTGPIPTELGQLFQMRTLWLAHNALTGPIPLELENLAALNYLGLQYNRLTGPIPPELGNLSALRVLRLGGNDLSGPIPVSFLKLSALGTLWIENTDLCVPRTDAFDRWRRQLSSPVPLCGDADRAALEKMYKAMDGAQWSRSDGWLSDVALSEWYGIAADSLERVVGIELPANNLKGQLPGSIADLTELKVLDISDNPGIQGRLPLDLNGHELETFRFAGTGLCSPKELQDWLAAIPMVEGTDAICPPLPDRAALVALYEATDGPNWTHNDNWLTDAPLGDWYGVEVDEEGWVVGLDLGQRYDREARQWISAAGLAGPIPPALGNLSRLETLNLSSNRNLTGPIPPELGNLSALTDLNLSIIRLTGSIPPELGNLSALETLSMRFTYNLSGPIPPELGKLSWLEQIDLSYNNLSGSIPPEFGKLSRLEQIDLSGNKITGPIPPKLGNLSRLRRIDLGDNNLTGPIPPLLGNISLLYGIDLSNNNLTGTIPVNLGKLSRLQWLRLNSNNLSGSIPSSFGDLISLRYLALDDNTLSGPIPSELGDLFRLNELHLNLNFLTGELPYRLGRLINLRSLKLSDNEGLSGSLPNSITALPLTRLTAINTGLCTPTNLAFQLLRETIIHYRVQQCSTDIAYLVQAVQSLHYPVPLIAGRNALLRVFPTAPEGTSVPVPFVRGLFYDPSGELVWTVEIPSTPGPLPAELDEGNLALSANGKVPGAVLRPGVEMVVEIDPEGLLDPALGVSQRVPAEGRTTLDIHDLPVMEMTMVPFLLTENPDSSVLAPVVKIAADPEEHELLAKMRAVLPAHKWTVTAHDPVWTDDEYGYDRLYELRAIRLMEGGRSYWMGTIEPRRYGLLGVAFVPGYTSMSILDPVTMAHELGHNLSLSHAPCNVGGDPDFPYRRGRSGAWGYDFTNGNLTHPFQPDIMGYCDNRTWISEYHFSNAIRHRAHREETAAPVRALLLWGGVDSAGVHLDPAFVVDASPSLPEEPGPYTLEGRNAEGRVLFSHSFAMPEVMDAGDEMGGFVYTLPVRPGWENLASITLSGPAGRARVDGSTARPMSIYRDRTGTVRAILRGEPMQADAMPGPLAGLALDVNTSRGIPAAAEWRR